MYLDWCFVGLSTLLLYHSISRLMVRECSLLFQHSDLVCETCYFFLIKSLKWVESCKYNFFELTITFTTCDTRSLCPVGKCQEYIIIFKFLSPLLSSNWGVVISSAMSIPLFSSNTATVTFPTDILENSHTCQVLDRITWNPECLE